MPERTVLVSYQGTVQGVGFRATTRRIARDFSVRGWVKNETDGSVSLIATAEPAELDAFLQALRSSRLGPLIDREVIEPAAASQDKGFSILR
jgi:acylphosphatase